jgi:hypothetical protein
VIDADGLVDIGAFERLVETNDNGIAYSSMDQVDMGLGLLRLYEAFASVAEGDDPRTGHLLALGLAAYGVVTDPVGKDGLRSKKTCEDDETLECSWFHAETSTNGKDSRAGGTLNKHLYAVRELYRAADILEPLGIAEGTQYRRLATEGLHQLVYADSGKDEGEAPNLKDFIPRHDDEPIPNSWLYYGRNNMTGKEYFLDNRPWKNCNYHILVLRLLHNTLPRAVAAGASIDGFTRHRGAYGMSLLAFVVQSYQLKDADTLFVDSATEREGFFGKCHDGKTKVLEDTVIQELLAM